MQTFHWNKNCGEKKKKNKSTARPGGRPILHFLIIFRIIISWGWNWQGKDAPSVGAVRANETHRRATGYLWQRFQLGFCNVNQRTRVTDTLLYFQSHRITSCGIVESPRRPVLDRIRVRSHQRFSLASFSVPLVTTVWSCTEEEKKKRKREKESTALYRIKSGNTWESLKCQSRCRDVQTVTASDSHPPQWRWCARHLQFLGNATIFPPRNVLVATKIHHSVYGGYIAYAINTKQLLIYFYFCTFFMLLTVMLLNVNSRKTKIELKHVFNLRGFHFCWQVLLASIINYYYINIFTIHLQ